MLGWTILFILIATLSALCAGLGPEGSTSLTARSASVVFSSLVVLSTFCELAGKAVRDSLR
jgi:uncharacterized membrane protein YtjA (UPF0391 family)